MTTQYSPKLAPSRRLPDKVRCAKGERKVSLRQDGANDDWRVEGQRVGAEKLEELPAICTGHHYVQEDQRWVLLRNLSDLP